MFEFLRRPQPVDSELPFPAYRLRAWPDLPDGLRTAAVYQAFSRMSQGPVSLRWFIDRSRLRPDDARDLFERLVYEGQLEVIDLAGFGTAPRLAARPNGMSGGRTPEFA